MEIKETGQLGLGVDCGGTYTDAVIYDLDSGEVLASHKYPTTHFDLTLCIDGVLEGLPPEMLRQARLVCLSTTLATNAIVEGKGGKACLILMGYDPAVTIIPYGAKVVRIPGGHDVRGGETEPLDSDSLCRAVRDNDEWADAFAVSGYFSVRNPQHEIRAHSIIAEETGKPIVCGHELSMQLDAPRRAGIQWLTDESTAVAQAKAQSKPMMIDFRADWCTYCVKLENETFPDPQVVREAKRFVALKLDYPYTKDPAVEASQKALKDKYKVVGLPTIAFVDSRGQLLPGKSITKFVKPEELLSRMRETR